MGWGKSKIVRGGCKHGVQSLAILLQCPFAMMLFFNARLLRISVYRSFLNVLRPLLSAAMMFGVLTAFHSEMPPSDSYGVLAMQTLAFVATGAIVYVGALLFFWRVLKIGEGSEDALYDFALEKLGRRKS